jgi:hypothetical protein
VSGALAGAVRTPFFRRAQAGDNVVDAWIFTPADGLVPRSGAVSTTRSTGRRTGDLGADLGGWASSPDSTALMTKTSFIKSVRPFLETVGRAPTVDNLTARSISPNAKGRAS